MIFETLRSPKVHYYNVKTKEWNDFSSLPHRTWNFRMINFNGFFYYCEGDGGTKDTVWRMRIAPNEDWEKLGTMPEAWNRYVWLIPYNY